MQTVRPRPDGNFAKSSSTAKKGARPITPSIPGIVNKPVTNVSQAVEDGTGRSTVALASQGARELRVQQPEALLRLNSSGINALQAEAREEYGYRAAYCTNYLTHYKPRVSLWALELKARGGERQYGKNSPRDRRDRDGRSTGGGARSTGDVGKSKMKAQSMSRSYSVFDRTQFGVA